MVKNMSKSSSNNRYNIRHDNNKRKRKNNLISGLIISGVFIAALIIVVNLAVSDVGIKHDKTEADAAGTSEGAQVSVESKEITTESVQTDKRSAAVKKAEMLAAQYDYDGAIEALKEVDTTDSDKEIQALITEYEDTLDSLVAVPPSEVTHVFFHSLIVDPKRGFSLTNSDRWNKATPGFCQWMTTCYEFDKMMEQMYENDFVLVSLYDMINITDDSDGVEYVEGKNIYLPEGKKPFVLSVDDVSYYHSYDDRGCASKMIVDDDGNPTCEYITADGETLTGAYDCVPRLDKFIEKHPDFSYKGAKGTIALTGYNGILGYRTDPAYRDKDEDNLLEDQIAWLKANPDFDWDKECAEARKVADAIKDDGWTFASHTWGHIRIGDSELDRIKTDNEKWKEGVEPLVGNTDIIIFAHGQDLAAWDEEYSETEKFRYLKGQGYTIFCNVDGSTKYFVQIGDEYLRMGRRNLDGIRLWRAIYGGSDLLSDLFDPSTVIDPDRPTDSSLYQ